MVSDVYESPRVSIVDSTHSFLPLCGCAMESDILADIQWDF